MAPSCSARTSRRSCRSCVPGGSDSANFDNVLELLTLAGRSLPHAADDDDPRGLPNRDGELPAELGGFYAFHSCLMEPWDGPAAVAFTDGRVIGATLDRNGLRPGRWVVTQGRPRGARLGGGHPADARRRTSSSWAGSRRASSSSSTLSRGGSFPTRRSSARSRRRSPTGLVRRAHDPLRRICRARRRARYASRCARSSSPSATPRGHREGAADMIIERPRSRSARWATTSRWRSSRTARRHCSTTSSSCSHRSRTRRSTRSARAS